MYAIQQTSTDKVVAGAITSFFLLIMYFVLHLANLPAVDEKTEIYEEINWTKFKPKPQRIVEQIKSPEPLPVEKPKKFEPPAPAPKPNTVKKVDLSTLEVFKDQTLSKPAQTLNKKLLPDKTAQKTGEQTKLTLKSSSLLAGLNTLRGDSPRLSLPKSGHKGRSRSSAISLAAKSGAAIKPQAHSDLGGTGNILGAPEGKELGSSSVQVSMLDVSRMGGDFEDLSPIYLALVEWMKQHPATFPAVVARFMEQSPGDLTASVQFQIDGRSFELFILCKTNLYEVRVCLLEGKQSTYLIDRGFKEKSSYLRVGSINRTPTGRILSFGTTRRQASDSRAQEFYQIFLSWWQSVKPQGQ